MAGKKKCPIKYDPEKNLYQVEEEWIQKSLKYFNGDRSKVAQALGLTERELGYKLLAMGYEEQS